MATTIKADIDENTLKALVIKHLESIGFIMAGADVRIEVKSKQNYKSEWEEAAFRATVRSQTDEV